MSASNPFDHSQLPPEDVTALADHARARMRGPAEPVEDRSGLFGLKAPVGTDEESRFAQHMRAFPGQDEEPKKEE